jgi:uncharacterized damage-inducible protein DinB
MEKQSDYFKENLQEIKEMVSAISTENYSSYLPVLSGSIGQHVRHILEFYQCLIKSVHTGIVCYDDRERNQLLESSREFVLQTIDDIQDQILSLVKDRKLMVRSNHSPYSDADDIHQSSLFRELSYCLEHSIHHMAIIKIGINQLPGIVPISEHFGIAPATLRYNSNRCAQ